MGPRESDTTEQLNSSRSRHRCPSCFRTCCVDQGNSPHCTFLLDNFPCYFSFSSEKVRKKKEINRKKFKSYINATSLLQLSVDRLVGTKIFPQ